MISSELSSRALEAIGKREWFELRTLAPGLRAIKGSISSTDRPRLIAALERVRGERREFFDPGAWLDTLMAITTAATDLRDVDAADVLRRAIPSVDVPRDADPTLLEAMNELLPKLPASDVQELCPAALTLRASEAASRVHERWFRALSAEAQRNCAAFVIAAFVAADRKTSGQYRWYQAVQTVAPLATEFEKRRLAELLLAELKEDRLDALTEAPFLLVRLSAAITPEERMELANPLMLALEDRLFQGRELTERRSEAIDAIHTALQTFGITPTQSELMAFADQIRRFEGGDCSALVPFVAIASDTMRSWFMLWPNCTAVQRLSLARGMVRSRILPETIIRRVDDGSEELDEPVFVRAAAARGWALTLEKVLPAVDAELARPYSIR